MTPEQEKMLNDLLIWKTQLESASSIPLNIDQSFRARFFRSILGFSAKTTASVTQAVNEGGSASYNVSKVPDGFLSFNDGGVTRNVPYFT